MQRQGWRSCTLKTSCACVVSKSRTSTNESHNCTNRANLRIQETTSENIKQSFYHCLNQFELKHNDNNTTKGAMSTCGRDVRTRASADNAPQELHTPSLSACFVQQWYREHKRKEHTHIAYTCIHHKLYDYYSAIYTNNYGRGELPLIACSSILRASCVSAMTRSGLGSGAKPRIADSWHNTLHAKHIQEYVISSPSPKHT